MVANSGWQQLNVDTGSGLVYVAQPNAPGDVVGIQVAGEQYPRIALDPANGVLVGNGTAPPIPIGSGSTDTSGFATTTDLASAFSSLQAQITALRSDTLANFVGSGVAETRGDLGGLYDGAGRWVKVPLAIWKSAFGASYTGSALETWVTGTSTGTPLSITTTTMPSGLDNANYAAVTLVAAGGTAPYTWSKTAGSLPANTALTGSTGVVAGTGHPVAGTFNFTVQVTDSLGATATQALSIVIAVAAAPFAYGGPTALPVATVGSNYSFHPADFCTNAAGTVVVSYGSPVQLPNRGIDINFSNGSALAGYIGNKRALTSADVTVAGTPMPAHFAVSDGVTTIQVAATLVIQAVQTPSFDLKPYVSNDYNKATGVGTYAYTTLGFKNAGDAVDVAANAAGITAGVASLVTTQGRLFCSVGSNTEGSRAIIPIGANSGATTWPVTGNKYNALINSGSDSTTGSGLNNWDCANVMFVVAPNQPYNDASGIGSAIYITQATAPVVRFVLDGNGANQNQTGGTNSLGTYFNGVTEYQCGAPNDAFECRNVRGVVGATVSTATEVFAFFYRWCAGGGTIISVQRMPDGSGHQSARTVTGVSFDPATDTATKVKHGFVDGQRVQLATVGTLTGISALTNYYVVSADGNNDTFKIALTPEGAAINIGGTTASVTVNGFARGGVGGQSASGTVWQNIGLNVRGRATATASVLALGYAMRHAHGAYCGGNLNFLAGSTGVGCQRAFNIEAGDPVATTNTFADTTGDVTWGSSTGATNGQLYTAANSDRAIIVDGNNKGSVIASTFQVGTCHVWGHDSSFDQEGYAMNGHAQSTTTGDSVQPNCTHFESHNARINQPTAYGLHFNSTGAVLTAQQSIAFLTACSIFLSGAGVTMNNASTYNALSPSHGQFSTLGSAPW